MNDFIILTSPPASGKTYWISSLKDVLEDQRILVISPLRALADECKAKWGDRIGIMTPEEWLGRKVSADVVIFDEFHLFFYWGDTFRPLMWEAFFELSLSAPLVFGLTATLSEDMQEELRNFRSQFSSIQWIDLGNQVLRYKPRDYVKLPEKHLMRELIFSQRMNADVKLVFCQYREEVFELERALRQRGYCCVSCVGGEAKFMAGKLLETPAPDFIISTTVLSHGVNLPSIKKVFFLYSVSNLDFWIQMVARGGRKGEEFSVFALESPYNQVFRPWVNFLRVLGIQLRLKVSSFFSSYSFDFS